MNISSGKIGERRHERTHEGLVPQDAAREAGKRGDESLEEDVRDEAEDTDND